MLSLCVTTPVLDLQHQEQAGQETSSSPEAAIAKLAERGARLAATYLEAALLMHPAMHAQDLKTVALGTSKINYMDPRITVAWCKRNEVPGALP